jgi:hypothetical protein
VCGETSRWTRRWNVKREHNKKIDDYEEEGGEEQPVIALALIITKPH